MKREQKTPEMRKRLAEAAGLPKDVVLGVSVLTMLGNGEIYIENYRGIIEYTETLIRVQTKETQIRLSGRCLQIAYYTNDEMKITGTVSSIEFCK